MDGQFEVMVEEKKERCGRDKRYTTHWLPIRPRSHTLSPSQMGSVSWLVWPMSYEQKWYMDFQSKAFKSQSQWVTFQLSPAPLQQLYKTCIETKEPQDGSSQDAWGTIRKKSALEMQNPNHTLNKISFYWVNLFLQHNQAYSASYKKLFLPKNYLSGMSNCWIYDQDQNN